MKLNNKKTTIISGLLVLLFGVLTSCSVSQDVYISKYYETTSTLSNNAIELYNNSEKAISLSKYNLTIYVNGNLDDLITIKLKGSIPGKDYYLITTGNENESIISDNSDLASENLKFNGNDAVAFQQGKKIIDIIGYASNTDQKFGENMTIIRKDRVTTPQEKYDPYNFIKYREDVFEYIKNSNYAIKGDADLIKGPRQTDELKALPFVDQSNTSNGGGGFTPVNYRSHIDGDTTKVDIPAIGVVNESIRYFFINTPETVAQSGAMAWGYPASNFTHKILDDTTTLELQLIPGVPYHDTYGRILGLLWSDGELIVFKLIRAGLTRYSSDPVALKYHYKDVLWESFFENAAIRAEKNVWGVYNPGMGASNQPGGDPMWNYSSGSKSGTNNDYIPPAHDEEDII